MPIIIDIRKDLRFKQGREEGKAEGKEETMIATAERMLRDGVHIPLVHKYTGLPTSEIEKLLEKIRDSNDAGK